MFKKVNGNLVEMTPEEEAEFLAQRAIDAAPLTEADLDAIADKLADNIMQQNTSVTRAIGLTLAEIVFRVSNGTIPQGVTEEQARNWVRDTIRHSYRRLL